MELGRQEGRQEGRDEGLLLGQRSGLLAGIETALELKFGAPGTALLPEIRELASVLVLQAVLTSIKSAAKVEDVRQAMTAANPS